MAAIGSILKREKLTAMGVGMIMEDMNVENKGIRRYGV